MTLIIFDSGKKVDLKVEEISIWMRIDMESVIYWQKYYHNLVRLGEDSFSIMQIIYFYGACVISSNALVCLTHVTNSSGRQRSLNMVNNEIADNMKQTLNIRYVWCPVGSHFARLDYEYLE
ncbi:hypothetical protein T10_7598 [Trichinella papuae]|uniref:Uncharacterized protein n=1 Tax=Trichinella papuae TaxID=268474 RepID=A0A0V1M764_9BILA|nr:hypothetical protein T10_7598 [Trichinella papuae]